MYEGSQSDCPESNRGRGALRCFTVKLHSEMSAAGVTVAAAYEF